MTKAWLQTVRYPEDCKNISAKIIKETLEYDFLIIVFFYYPSLIYFCVRVLEQAGFVESASAEFNVQKFVNTEISTLTD
ncbi:MAG TPA: hypothetical protein VGO47_01915 [Chlamydiales bacterium]|nr:hypothetical protein [Chlamydiales bacterium]